MDILADQAELFPFAQIDDKAGRRSTLRRYIEATMEHGPLVPQTMIAATLGVSKQRVAQFIDQGRLASITIDDRRFVPAASVDVFMTEQRSNGRPRKINA
jgi:hypothetical protein